MQLFVTSYPCLSRAAVVIEEVFFNRWTIISSSIVSTTYLLLFGRDEECLCRCPLNTFFLPCSCPLNTITLTIYTYPHRSSLNIIHESLKFFVCTDLRRRLSGILKNIKITLVLIFISGIDLQATIQYTKSLFSTIYLNCLYWVEYSNSTGWLSHFLERRHLWILVRTLRRPWQLNMM